jgi:phospholipid transport system substrate-binding protein
MTKRALTPWKRGSSGLLAALVLAAATAAAAEPDGDRPAAARAVVQGAMDQVMTVLADGAVAPGEKRGRIEKIAYEHFDFETITRLVLAKNYSKLSPEQRADFLTEFKQHLSLTYGRRLESARDEKIEVLGARPETKGDVTVKTVVRGGPADGVAIDYRMREKGGTWRVIDVVIENVSLVSNFRSQVQEIVSNKGADSLIETLRKKNQKAAATET